MWGDSEALFRRQQSAPIERIRRRMKLRGEANANVGRLGRGIRMCRGLPGARAVPTAIMNAVADYLYRAETMMGLVTSMLHVA